MISQWRERTTCHVMCDVETTNLRMDARITSVAFVPFTLHHALMQREDAIHLALTDYRGSGILNVQDDPQTMAWREEHEVDERESHLIRMAPRDFVHHVADRFALWHRECEAFYLWAWHSDYDIALLKRLFDAYLGERPWHHRSTRDAPTFISAFNHDPLALMQETKKQSFEGMMSHDAYVDCRVQVLTMQRAVGILP